MNKPCAESIKESSLKAIIEVSKIVQFAREQRGSHESGILVCAAGNIIGLIETDTLAMIYREYPELGDLA